jgi:uncharacterized protein
MSKATRLALGCLCLAIWLAVMTRATAGEPNRKTRVLLVTGMDYPGHKWQETSLVLAKALGRDPRLEVRVAEDPWFLDSAALDGYDVLVLHFQNWEQPGPGSGAKEKLKSFVAGGKGLVLVHFACGAWHGEWPEFQELAGRVWFGSNPGPGKRQHDPLGPFTVEICKPDHPITKGMKAFGTRDELYTCLTGEYPIEVVAQAKSKVDGVYYPIAFGSQFQKGRTFHCILGHDAAALSVAEVQELYARGCAWAAGL